MSLSDPNFDPDNPQNVPADIRERAERLGTWRKIKRDRQYAGPERARNEALHEAVNAYCNHVRGLQVEKQTMFHELLTAKNELAKTRENVKELNRRVWYYKFKSAILSATLGAAAYSGIKLAATALATHFLR